MTGTRWSAVAACLLIFASLAAALQTSGPVQYVYDELGRLIGVIDANGNAAVYNYDAVGNILSITPYPSTQVSVISFTPDQGAVGASVTVYGTGFSPMPSQDTVTFNGTVATVTSASTNQLVVAVPSGATAGPISVTSPTGSATSASSFTIITGAAPTITGFSPTVGTSGTVASITGTNFDPSPLNDRLSFNVAPALPTAAAATTISTSVPVGATSGHVTVSTPAGAATSSQDFFIPFGTHTTADVAYTARTTVGGAATVTLSTAPKIGLVVFDGIAGQRVSVQWASTIANCNLYLFTPRGAQAAFTSCGTASGSIQNTLLSTGTYTIGIEAPYSVYTGSVNLQIADVSDVTGTIAIDGPAVTATTTKPNQDARLTFSAIAGQKVFLQVSVVTNPSATVNLQSLADETLSSLAIANAPSGQHFFMDTQSLVATGRYTLWIQHSGANVGSETLQLTSAPDVTGTISIDGTPVTITTTALGQDARLTFTATAGQRVFVQITNVTNPSAYVYLVKPDGTNQTYTSIGNSPGQTFFIDTQTLTAAGTYQLWVQHYSTNIGNETLQITSVPADATATLTVPVAGAAGAASTVTTTKAGQNASFSFSGTSGQKLSFNVNSTSYASCSATVLDPSNNTVTSLNCAAVGTGVTVTLGATGPYTIFVNPPGTNTGSVTMSINNDDDVTGTIAIDGAAVTTGTTVAGQDARLSFTATAGQRIVTYATSVTNPYAWVYLVKPDGTNQIYFNINNSSPGQTFFLDTQTLATSGTYQLWVQHYSTDVGSETLQIASVPADFTGTLTINGGALQVPATGSTSPGQNATLTFSAAAGQSLKVNFTNSTFTPSTACLVTLKNPSGGTVTSGYCGSGATTPISATAATAGTYTILVDPQGASTGSISISVTSP
jgi:YD repeat-containing protein